MFVSSDDEFVCEHGYVRCEGCEECIDWARSWQEHYDRLEQNPREYAKYGRDGFRKDWPR